MTNPTFLNRLMDDGRDKVAESKPKRENVKAKEKEVVTDEKVYHTL
jgi:hypothetical protein